jgi:hypothetical protein
MVYGAVIEVCKDPTLLFIVINLEGINSSLSKRIKFLNKCYKMTTFSSHFITTRLTFEKNDFHISH